jgi:sugar/nucleoside kinase (ribokinase family)
MDTKPTNILSVDLLICDAKVQKKDAPVLNDLIADYAKDHAHEFAVKSDGKYTLSKEEFEKWEAALEGNEHVKYSMGGSAANTLASLKKLRGDKVNINFIGGFGNDKYGAVIEDAMQATGFRLIPSSGPIEGLDTTVSFVVNDGSERQIFTYRGNSSEKIPQLVNPAEAVALSDIIMLPASAWDNSKYGKVFLDELASERFRQQKELWVSLPTSPKVGEEERQRFKYVLPSANIILANADELMRTSNEDSLDEALGELAGAFKPELLKRYVFPETQQVGFITDSYNPSWVVENHQSTRVSSIEVDEESIASKLGAGDAAFAGFLYATMEQRDQVAAGLRKNIDSTLSAQIGGALATETMFVPQARLEDPAGALARRRYASLMGQLHPVKKEILGDVEGAPQTRSTQQR